VQRGEHRLHCLLRCREVVQARPPAAVCRTPDSRAHQALARRARPTALEQPHRLGPGVHTPGRRARTGRALQNAQRGGGPAGRVVPLAATAAREPADARPPAARSACTAPARPAERRCAPGLVMSVDTGNARTQPPRRASRSWSICSRVRYVEPDRTATGVRPHTGRGVRREARPAPSTAPACSSSTRPISLSAWW